MPTKPDSATDCLDAPVAEDAAAVLDDNISCAPTELDSDSDDANAATTPGDANAALVGDDAVMVISSGDEQENSSVCSYKHIKDTLKCLSVLGLRTELALVQGGDDCDHSVRYVQEMLKRGYVHGFKVGATHLPLQRWQRYKEEVTHRWREMVVVAVTASLEEIKRLERSVISVFRRYNAQRVCINPVDGHPLCLNRLPGGESLNHGHSPFFLYVVRK